MTAYFWRSDYHMEIIITLYNEKQVSIGIFKFVQLNLL